MIGCRFRRELPQIVDETVLDRRRVSRPNQAIVRQSGVMGVASRCVICVSSWGSRIFSVLLIHLRPNIFLTTE